MGGLFGFDATVRTIFQFILAMPILSAIGYFRLFIEYDEPGIKALIPFVSGKTFAKIANKEKLGNYVLIMKMISMVLSIIILYVIWLIFKPWVMDPSVREEDLPETLAEISYHNPSLAKAVMALTIALIILFLLIFVFRTIIQYSFLNKSFASVAWLPIWMFLTPIACLYFGFFRTDVFKLEEKAKKALTKENKNNTKLASFGYEEEKENKTDED